ncbi:MAG: carboxypeptidase-like regulatory domain-containing protein [Flavobacteriaceae bacterium]|nr:carboxypeptidase-like regulatory domain-containing protein [Flavobacteriaceae bacterium]
MNKTTITLSSLFIVNSISVLSAQEIRSKIIDSITKKPIPYATVIFNKKGLVSNEEGRFSFQFSKGSNPKDTLRISCIGYETLAKPIDQYRDSVIFLSPKVYEIEEVILTNKNYSADEIIGKVKENLTNNYNTDYTNKRIFFRQGSHQYLLRTDYTLEKSTIEEFDKNFLDNALKAIPKQNSYYSETLCELYGNFDKENQKIHIIKASKMYNKDNEQGLLAIEKKFNKIIGEHIKPDSYFKVKSGIFGSKVERDELFATADSTEVKELKQTLEEEENKEKASQENFAKFKKMTIANMLDNMFFLEDSGQNFIYKSNRYEFTIKDMQYLGEEPVYVLDFTPKGSQDYAGTLYITMDNFAIIRADYHNVRPIKKFSLLGISFRHFKSDGKMIFSKATNGRYNLQYIEDDNSSTFGVRRPLKIIEKNKHVKGRRKQNELYVKIDMAVNQNEKRQLVVFDTQNITQTAYGDLTESNTVMPVYMKAYDPDFWKGYTIIEPNQAIRNFTVEEQSSEKSD